MREDRIDELHRFSTIKKLRKSQNNMRIFLREAEDTCVVLKLPKTI